MKPHPKQISHVAEVEKVEQAGGKAVMYLKEVQKLPQSIPLDVIRKKVKMGELSGNMRRCGTPYRLPKIHIEII